MPTHRFVVSNCLFNIDDRYQFEKFLGKGSYGVVCAAKDRQNHDKLVAIKKISRFSQKTSSAKHTLRELRLLRYLGHHPNIMCLENAMIMPEEDEVYLVMSIMDTDLHRVIQSQQSLSDQHLRFFLHQLVKGLAFLHAHKCLHRDIKPGNLLVTKSCQLVITDFGLARLMPQQHRHSSRSQQRRSGSAKHRKTAPMTEHVVTRWYRAPEIMLQPDGYYTGAVDMWSVGCILGEMLARKPLFPGKNFVDQLSLIFDVLGTPSLESIANIKSLQAQRFCRSVARKTRLNFRSFFPTAHPEALDLLDKLLQFNPRERLTAAQVLAHPYVAGLEARHRAQINPTPVPFHLNFDEHDISRQKLQNLIVKEVSEIQLAQNPKPQVTEEEDKALRRPSSSASTRSSQRPTFLRPGSATGLIRKLAQPGRIMIHPQELGLNQEKQSSLANNNNPLQPFLKQETIVPATLPTKEKQSLLNIPKQETMEKEPSPSDEKSSQEEREPPHLLSAKDASAKRRQSVGRVQQQESLMCGQQPQPQEIMLNPESDKAKSKTTTVHTEAPDSRMEDDPTHRLLLNNGVRVNFVQSKRNLAHHSSKSLSSQPTTLPQQQQAPKPEQQPTGSAFALLRQRNAVESLQLKPKAKKVHVTTRRKKLTKPQSPKFSTMSWEKRNQRRAVRVANNLNKDIRVTKR